MKTAQQADTLCSGPWRGLGTLTRNKLQNEDNFASLWASQKLTLLEGLSLDDRWSYIQLFYNSAKLSQIKGTTFSSTLLWKRQMMSHTKGWGIQKWLQLHQHVQHSFRLHF